MQGRLVGVAEQSRVLCKLWVTRSETHGEVDRRCRGAGSTRAVNVTVERATVCRRASWAITQAADRSKAAPRPFDAPVQQSATPTCASKLKIQRNSKNSNNKHTTKQTPTPATHMRVLRGEPVGLCHILGRRCLACSRSAQRSRTSGSAASHFQRVCGDIAARLAAHACLQVDSTEAQHNHSPSSCLPQPPSAAAPPAAPDPQAGSCEYECSWQLARVAFHFAPACDTPLTATAVLASCHCRQLPGKHHHQRCALLTAWPPPFPWPFRRGAAPAPPAPQLSADREMVWCGRARDC